MHPSSPSRIAPAIVALALALGAHEGAARAQTAPRSGSADADRQALALYEEGSAAFAREEYSTAAARFEAAFNLSPRPRILYNLGVTYDRLNLPEQAIDAYERFLHQLPNARERSEVEARVRALRAEAELAQERARQESAAAAAAQRAANGPTRIVSERVVERPVPPPEPPHTARTVGIVFGALTLAAVGATVGVHVFASRYYDNLRRDCGDLRHMDEPNAPWCSRAVIDDVQLRGTLTNTLLFTTVGLGIASGVSFAIDLAQPRPRARPRAALSVSPAPGGAMILVGGSL